jgi:toxin ParE1/3/4
VAKPSSWRPRLSAPAERDFASIFVWTAERFGIAQARRYRALIHSAIRALETGPDPLGSKARNDILPDLRSFHVAREGQQARHFLLYRPNGDWIDILRILHDSMEIARHLPKTSRPGKPKA